MTQTDSPCPPCPCCETPFHVGPPGHVEPGPPCHFDPSPATRSGPVSPATWSFVPGYPCWPWWDRETGRIADLTA